MFTNILSYVHATISCYVYQMFGWSASEWHFWVVFGSMLLPNCIVSIPYPCPCPSARDLGSHLSNLVSLHIQKCNQSRNDFWLILIIYDPVRATIGVSLRTLGVPTLYRISALPIRSDPKHKWNTISIYKWKTLISEKTRDPRLWPFLLFWIPMRPLNGPDGAPASFFSDCSLVCINLSFIWDHCQATDSICWDSIHENMTTIKKLRPVPTTTFAEGKKRLFLKNRSFKYFLLPGSCLVLPWTIQINKKTQSNVKAHLKCH